MSEKTLNELKDTISASAKLDESLKKELNVEIDQLIKELKKVEHAEPDLAQTVARATLKDVANKINHPESEHDQEAFVNDLILEFEASHPRMTSSVQNIVNMLANIGI